MRSSKPRTFESEVSRDESLCATMVRDVASISGTPVDSLPTLFASIDPDAVDSIFSPNQSASTLTFSYHEYEITVTAASPESSTLTVTYEEMTPSDEQFRV